MRRARRRCRSTRPIRSANSATFLKTPIRLPLSTTPRLRAKSNRSLRRSASRTQCGSARVAARLMRGRTAGAAFARAAAVARRSCDLAIYRWHDRTAEGRQHQPSADGGEYQSARSSAADVPGRRKHPLHDAAVPCLRGGDVSSSRCLLRRTAGHHAALPAGRGARPYCRAENHPLAGRADGVHRFARAREVQSNRFLLLAHGLFRLGAAAGGDDAAMVGADRHADPGGVRTNRSRARADVCARGWAFQSRLVRSRFAAHHARDRRH